MDTYVTVRHIVETIKKLCVKNEPKWRLLCQLNSFQLQSGSILLRNKLDKLEPI